MQSMRDIVGKCLIKDASKRPSAAQLLEHKFFKVTSSLLNMAIALHFFQETCLSELSHLSRDHTCMSVHVCVHRKLASVFAVVELLVQPLTLYRNSWQQPSILHSWICAADCFTADRSRAQLSSEAFVGQPATRG